MCLCSIQSLRARVNNAIRSELDRIAVKITGPVVFGPNAELLYAEENAAATPELNFKLTEFAELARQTSVLTESLHKKQMQVLHLKGAKGTHIYRISEHNYLVLETAVEQDWKELDAQVEEILGPIQEALGQLEKQ